MTMDWLVKKMPILRWLPAYDVHQSFKSDLIAAVTVAVMLIPQEMSLSSLMGVPIQNGFYTAAIAPMVYPWFGSSSSASIANTAEGSLLVSVMLSGLGDRGSGGGADGTVSQERVQYAVVLSLFTGLFLVLGGLFHAGKLINFFSRTCMNGYINATCSMIILSQIAPWMGISVGGHNSQLTILTLVEILANVRKANVFSCLLGVFCIMFLTASKSFKKQLQTRLKAATAAVSTVQKMSTVEAETEASSMLIDRTATCTIENDHVTTEDCCEVRQELMPTSEVLLQTAKQVSKPSAASSDRSVWMMTGLLFLCDTSSLLVCLMSICVGYLLGKDRIDVVGHVEPGLPSLKLPWQSLDGRVFANVAGQVITDALVLALVFFMSSMAISRKLALARGDQILPNQEFLGLGFANVCVALFQGTPSAAGLSRSAVNAQHAQTPLASVMTSWIVMLVLIFCTQLLYFLPKAPLCAIIITAATSILDVSEWKRLRHIKKHQEAYLWLVSFVGTLVLGLLRGLAFSIACSVVLLGIQTSNPRVATLGIVVHDSLSSSSFAPTTIGVNKKPSQQNDQVHTWTFVELGCSVQAHELAEVLVVRVYQSLYFGNCAQIIEQVEQLLDQKQANARVVGVVVDTSRVNDIDATSLVLLQEFASKIQTSRDQTLTFANTTPAIHESLVASGFQASTPLEFTQSISLAVERVYGANW